MLNFAPFLRGISVIAFLGYCVPAAAVTPNDAEFAARDEWVKARFEGDGVQPPFSFEAAGRPSLGDHNAWKRSTLKVAEGEERTIQRLSWKDTSSGLKADCELVVFHDFPAVEWLVELENIGTADTPILEQIQSLDLGLKRAGGKEFRVHYANGGQTQPDDFRPISAELAANEELKFGSTYDLSSGQKLPFFGVEYDDQGFLAAVGWSGSWMVSAKRDGEKGLHVQAGMYASHTETPRFCLRPGERIRTPRLVMLFWKQDRLHGHNLWRQLLLKHYVLRRHGQTVRAPICSLNWGLASAKEHIAKMDWLTEHELPVEVYWIDAGWSGHAGLKFEEWGAGAANRVPRPDLFPQGIRPLSDAAHERGLKLLLWVWPHRAVPGVEIGAEHPEWIVPGEGLDHGDPQVNEWMIKRYGDMVQDFGLDIFRQDGHPVIPADESPDRKGMRQIRYVEGFYEFWDQLLRRHPALIIDNCAAGGRKIDIETLQRSIPLWRSDTQVDVNFDPVFMQGQTYGISYWVPISSGVASFPTSYSMRSGYGPGLNIQWHAFQRKIDDHGFDFDSARRFLLEFHSLREYFYGDYYPLTEYSLSHENWMAWQFHREDLGAGVLQAFRRRDSPYQAAQFKLHGLETDAEYLLTNLDNAQTTTESGKTLRERGITVSLPTTDSAAIYTYKRVH